jgi:hypothetical protein
VSPSLCGGEGRGLIPGCERSHSEGVRASPGRRVLSLDWRPRVPGRHGGSGLTLL